MHTWILYGKIMGKSWNYMGNSSISIVIIHNEDTKNICQGTHCWCHSEIPQTTQKTLLMIRHFPMRHGVVFQWCHPPSGIRSDKNHPWNPGWWDDHLQFGSKFWPWHLSQFTNLSICLSIYLTIYLSIPYLWWWRPRWKMMAKSRLNDKSVGQGHTYTYIGYIYIYIYHVLTYIILFYPYCIQTLDGSKPIFRKA